MVPVPKGFAFAVAAAGFKKPGRNDLAVMASKRPAVGAGVFTTNLFQAAPVTVARENLQADGPVRGFVVNSGQANACTGDIGLVNCRVSLDLVGQNLGLEPAQLLPASTGVIGQHLKMELFREAMPAIRESYGKTDPIEAAKAIMTTDTFPKLAWAEVKGYDAPVRLLGMCKGAGMICPNMATMLAFVFCDAEVDASLWRALVAKAADESFNRVTVDGDTSTNDCLMAMANGASGVTVTEQTQEPLYEALAEVCGALSYMIVQDAEGGTKVIRIKVTGAADDAQAELAARAVAHSPLVKTAMYGRDANWGRICAALGRSGASFDPDAVSVSMAGIRIFDKGEPVQGDMDSLLKPHLMRRDVALDVSLGDGPGRAVLLASDLTHEYVSINADYRT